MMQLLNNFSSTMGEQLEWDLGAAVAKLRSCQRLAQFSRRLTAWGRGWRSRTDQKRLTFFYQKDTLAKVFSDFHKNEEANHLWVISLAYATDFYWTIKVLIQYLLWPRDGPLGFCLKKKKDNFTEENKGDGNYGLGLMFLTVNCTDQPLGCSVNTFVMKCIYFEEKT